MTIFTHLDTPSGRLLLTAENDRITGIHWVVFKRAPKVLPDWIEDAHYFKPLVRQINEYFAGNRKSFDLKFNYKGTDFQKSVWNELVKIPFGTKSTYSAIAESIGKPKAVRAVGTAVGSNPISIIVPCHRILTTAGTIGGYAGGIDAKHILLEIENIHLAK